MAWRVNRYTSIGWGLVYSQIKSELNFGGYREKGSGSGYSFQAGSLISCGDGFNIGINYRGQVKADLKGNGSLGSIGESYNTDIRFPGTLSFGIAWDTNYHLKWIVNYDLEMWSSLQEVNHNYSNPLMQTAASYPLKAANSHTISLGTIYTTYKIHEYRLGLAYRDAAITGTSLIPAYSDFGSQIISLGYSRYNPNGRLDLGYEFTHSDTREGSFAAYSGQYGFNQHLFMLGITLYIGNLPE